MPRSSKISKELIDEFLTYKENGLNDEDCCNMVGISTQTLYRWLKEAETGIDGDNPDREASNLELKREFRDGLKRAQVAFKAFHVQNITKASKRSWQASAWILERMYPKEFGRIDRQFAIMGDASKENGMLDEILEYMRLAKNVPSDK